MVEPNAGRLPVKRVTPPNLPRVRSLPHEFRHRWHPFDRRWITRVSPGFGRGYLDKTTPRIPKNMGRACSELNHGFRQKIPGVSLAELPMGFAGLCWVGPLFHTYRCVGSVACIGPMARSESSD